jgi:hypothetical protein
MERTVFGRAQQSSQRTLASREANASCTLPSRVLCDRCRKSQRAPTKSIAATSLSVSVLTLA